MRTKPYSGVIVLLLCLSTVSAQISVQLKRTNPGIAKEKVSELIFDIVNTDMSHQIESFLWCKSPDDAVVSSTYGVGTGSGAQYVSPKFTMDVGPSQEAMTLEVNADSPGDKRTGCYVKYIPFKVTTVTSVETVDETTTETVVDEETGETTTRDVVTPVEKTVTTEVKQYLKMNNEYVSVVEDRDYREIRLDKTAPFAAQGVINPRCPPGHTHCTADEIQWDSSTPSSDVISVGETKIYSVGDKDYEVTLSYTDGIYSRFTVNGMSTDAMQVGETDVLADGSEIGVADILYRNYAGGVHQVEFYLSGTSGSLEAVLPSTPPLTTPAKARGSVKSSWYEGVLEARGAIDWDLILPALVLVLLIIVAFLIRNKKGKQRASNPEKTKKEFCPFCGGHLEPGDKFCPACGGKEK